MTPRSLPPLVLALLLVVASLPAAEAQEPEPCPVVEGPTSITLDDCSAVPPVKECKRVELDGTFVHVMVDPACLGVPIPVIPGMEASCDERKLHPESGSTPCCDEKTCCSGPPECCPEAWCCSDPSCCAQGPCCPYPECCHNPTCCKTPACCRGELRCLVAVMVAPLRERIGAEAGGHGVCVDFGQHDNGSPYANVDPAASCTRPASQERIRILP